MTELPGMEAKDIDLTFQNGSLVLKGEKKLENEHKDENYHRFECRYSAFQRTVPLPSEVDRDKAEAKFKNGILEITVPKAETSHTLQSPAVPEAKLDGTHRSGAERSDPSPWFYVSVSGSLACTGSMPAKPGPTRCSSSASEASGSGFCSI